MVEKESTVIPNTSSCGAPGAGVDFKEENRRKTRGIEEEYMDGGKRRKNNPRLFLILPRAAHQEQEYYFKE